MARIGMIRGISRVASGTAVREAVPWVFPGLVIAMVVGNQGWAVSGLLGGQILSWSVDAAALLVVIDFFQGQRWPFALAGGIVLSRLVGSGYRGGAVVD